VILPADLGDMDITYIPPVEKDATGIDRLPSNIKKPFEILKGILARRQ